MQDIYKVKEVRESLEIKSFLELSKMKSFASLK